MSFRHAFAAVSLVILAALSGCGSEGSSSSGGSTGTQSSASCCLNGSWYDCPSDSEATTCFDKSDPSGCTRNSDRDKECK